MILHKLSNGVRLLVSSDENQWLTNGETYSQIVYLGIKDTPDNWKEVTKDEYDNYLKLIIGTNDD